MTRNELILSEKDLITALRQGQEEAYKKVFELYYVQLCRYAFFFVKDHDNAEEIVQECLCNLYSKRKSLFIQSSLKFYLFQSVKNRCLNFLQQKQNQSLHHQNLLQDKKSDIQIEEIYEDDDKYSEIINKIKQALESLPKELSEVFIMSKFSGLTYPEIAEIKGVSEKTIERRMTKSFKLLRDLLKHSISIIVIFLIKF